MDSFKKLLREIDENINHVILFNVVTRVTLLFLVVFLILSLFNFYPLMALVPTSMYLVMLLYLNLSKNKARMIGGNYPAIKEKLITAYDYRNAENVVVRELQEEVISDMGSVRLSSFINQKKIFARIFFIVLFSFAITIISFFNITILDIGTNFENMKDNPATLGVVLSQQEDFFNDIFGEGSDVKYGNEELRVEIRPIGYEIDVRQLSEIPEETFGENSFPQEVFVQSSESFQEDFSKDHADLIKEYFQKITKN